MFRIGLTGGIASGKTEVARVLKELGAHVIDADALGARVVEPGTPALERLIAAFGTDILATDGRIERAKVARMVFLDESKLKKLNEIIHPELIREIRLELESLERSDPDGTVVVDAALLVEWGVLDMFDLVVGVRAPHAMRLERLLKDGSERDEAVARMESQLPDNERMAAVGVVLDNRGSLDDLRSQVEKLHAELEDRMKGGD